MTRLIAGASAGVIHVGDRAIPCAIGRGGVCAAADKREGDGCTPSGIWPIRAALLRRDRGLTPPRALPWRWIRTQDGWSDDPPDPAYNQPVRHPHCFSAERLWRDDGLYDALLVLGYNDRPPISFLGSAIFLHISGDGLTEGCVAISCEDMAILLSTLASGDDIRIC